MKKKRTERWSTHHWCKTDNNATYTNHFTQTQPTNEQKIHAEKVFHWTQQNHLIKYNKMNVKSKMVGLK